MKLFFMRYHGITYTRWGIIVFYWFILFQDSVSNAEMAVDNHKSFDSAVSDLTDLIQSISESLEQVHNVPITKEAVGDALKKVQVTIQYC